MLFGTPSTTQILGELNGELYPYHYVPIIPKNTPIPARMSEAFFTVLDEQKDVINPLTSEMSNRFQMAWATLESKANPNGSPGWRGSSPSQPSGRPGASVGIAC